MISFESIPENFKGTYPSVRYIIDCKEHFYQRPWSLTVQSKVPFIQAPSTMLHMQ